MRIRMETKFLLVFVVGMFAGASVGWRSWNECQDTLLEVKQERDWTYKVYDKYRTLYDDKMEAHKDAGFERMIREQVTEVITDYECGRSPFPPDLCVEENGNICVEECKPRDVLDQKLLREISQRQSSF